MYDYKIKKSEMQSWNFTTNSKKIKDIKENAKIKLESLPGAFNINGNWSIIQLVDNGSNYPDKKFITSITI